MTNANGEVRVIKTVYIPHHIYDALVGIATDTNRTVMSVINDTLVAGLVTCGVVDVAEHNATVECMK